MAERIIECVPNFSEGRDICTVEAIVNAIAAVAGVHVLGKESDVDHNRSVITFAGEPHAVVSGALRGIAKAVELIDLSKHAGVHPRIGAADVVPLVPVTGVTLEECAALAHELGEQVWRALRLPVYFYEAAARCEERRRLENVRRGGIGWLRDHIGERPPDIGDRALHPTAGAVIIGARKFLIAFNVNLSTDDVEVARSVARKVRESSGGLPSVKAIGVSLDSRGVAQVSLNLTDFERTGIGQAFEAVKANAAALGVEVAGSQIIGLVPRQALVEAAATLVRCENYGPERVLEERLEQCAPHRSFDRVLDQISSPASPVGGGSAAALAGAISASLGLMVARIGKRDAEPFLTHREFFASAVERDAAAFEGVRAGGDRQAWRTAALVPTEISERARHLDRDLLSLKDQVPLRVQSDLTTALALARAARAGAMAAARANLPNLDDAAFRAEIEDRLDRKLPH